MLKLFIALDAWIEIIILFYTRRLDYTGSIKFNKFFAIMMVELNYANRIDVTTSGLFDIELFKEIVCGYTW